MVWLWWWVMLVFQQASQTMTMRARAGSSLKVHAFAAVFSNGVWLISQFVIIDQWSSVRGHPWLLALTAAYYITFCVIGSVSMHGLMMRVENRKKVAGR